MNKKKTTENAAKVLLAVEENKNVSLWQIRRNCEIHFAIRQKF